MVTRLAPFVVSRATLALRCGGDAELARVTASDARNDSETPPERKLHDQFVASSRTTRCPMSAESNFNYSDYLRHMSNISRIAFLTWVAFVVASYIYIWRPLTRYKQTREYFLGRP